MKKSLRALSLMLALIIAFSTSALAAPRLAREIEDKYDDVDYYTDLSFLEDPSKYLLTVERGGRYGFVNEKGEEVVPAIYDSAETFGDFGFLRLDDKVALTNMSGTFITDFVYEPFGMVSISENGYLTGDQNRKYGMIDVTGRQVLPFIYEDIGTIYDGLVAAKLNGHVGIVNLEGEIVIPFEYDATACCFQWGRYQFFNGYAAARLGGKWGLITPENQVFVPFEYEDIGFFNDGMVSVQRDGRWGYADATGAEIIPCIYESATVFSEGTARVTLDGQPFAIDKAGNTRQLEAMEYDYSYFFSSLDEPNEDFKVVVKDGLYGVVQVSTGIETIPPIYERLSTFIKDIDEPIEATKNDKIGYLSIMGDILYPIVIDSRGMESESLIIIEIDGKYGFISNNCRMVIEPVYDQVRPFAEGLAAVSLDGKWGFIDRAGQVVVPIIYERVLQYSYGLAAVKLEGLWGFMDTKGTLAIDHQFENGGAFNATYAVLHSFSNEYDDLYGFGFWPYSYYSDAYTVQFIDRQGTPLTGMIDGEVSQFSPDEEQRLVEALGVTLPVQADARQAAKLYFPELQYNTDRPLTREEACRVMARLYWRMSGRQLAYPSLDNSFTDTATVEVLSCREAGIVTGHGAEGMAAFQPEAPITMLDFSVMLYRTLELCQTAGTIELPEADRSAWAQLQSYAVKAVATLDGIGFFTSMGVTFDPAGEITREDALDAIVALEFIFQVDLYT